MEIVFIEQAWEDYLYWQAHDKKVLKKVNKLIKAIERSPFEGIGSPEPLKYNLAGYWSRRITLEHRLVYRIKETQIRIIQCRYHY
jgi:toxin YoeB